MGPFVTFCLSFFVAKKKLISIEKNSRSSFGAQKLHFQNAALLCEISRSETPFFVKYRILTSCFYVKYRILTDQMRKPVATHRP